MRVGILGGTFNPVHNGHVTVAKEALARLDLDNIVFVPAYMPPHKDTTELISADDRYEMIELAIGDNEDFHISRFEIERKQRSYSIETINHFIEIYPDNAKLYFLIGADSSVGLGEWKDIDKLLSLCKFVVFDRPGFDKRLDFPEVESLEITGVDISSTQIRSNIKQNKPITGLVPEPVEDYIISHNLYR